VSLMWRWRWS